ncbi:MAG: hypothetical protein GX102_00910 [Porphyromonadaceae bacterium]|nr:hypothetical protein [Porphyromonadaceae bacterium]
MQKSTFFLMGLGRISVLVLIFLLPFVIKLSAQEKIPILAWYSIPASDATVERYQELKDAGFTITFSHTSNFEDAKNVLDLAATVGIKSMFTCSELESDPEGTVRKVKDHPGLAGYFLRDEPTSKDFPTLAEWAKRIRAVDNIHHCYLNLFPNYVPEDVLGETYEEHVQRFIEEVNLEMVSFDFYPIVRDQLRERWYDNLEVIAEKSRAAGKPFWAFALTTAHDDYPIPNAAQLKLQMYSNLAYGAQCLQYFTYWNPGTTHWNFHEAPITSEKKRSPVYDLVREVNKELQNRAFVFMGANVISLHHIGNEIPVGTKKLTILPEQVTSLDTDGGGAVISLLEKDGFQYLVIVNRSFLKPLDLRIQFNGQVEAVRKDGTLDDASKYGSWYKLEAGEAEIFRWKETN